MDHVRHPSAKETLLTLSQLSRRARDTTPFLLLSAAVDRLCMRAKLAARGDDQAGRAIANLDLLLERSRRYGVRGLKQLALDIGADWQGGRLGPEPYDEARLDADGEAINVVTVHSAKGLEWPIVIPINMASEIRRREPFIHRRGDDTLHWVLGDVVPPALVDAVGTEDRESGEERERLLYVACTRAMDILILPQFSARRPDNTWAQVLNLADDNIPEWDMTRLKRKPFAPVADVSNLQTAEVFLAEQQAVIAASKVARWIRPSQDDSDRSPKDLPTFEEATDFDSTHAIAGSSTRGAVLHKLIEEVLTGETEETTHALTLRAGLLLAELGPLEGEPRPDPAEMANVVVRTFALPAISEHRGTLIPELALYAQSAGGDVLMAGRADAVAVVDGQPTIVFDWKSDVAPSAVTRQSYAGQLLEYMRAIGAPRGAIVYLTLGSLDWVDLPSQHTSSVH